MFMTGGAPQKPVTLLSVIVDVGEICAVGTGFDVGGSVVVVRGFGVHVGGN